MNIGLAPRDGERQTMRFTRVLLAAYKRDNLIRFGSVSDDWPLRGAISASVTYRPGISTDTKLHLLEFIWIGGLFPAELVQNSKKFRELNLKC